jgi:ectoine hydroxylase-related dioxygenase (phytanoyl-CoA dioxygenase family)
MMSASDLATFERDGAVTVDTTFTAPELDAAERGWDALAALLTRSSPSRPERQGYREMGVQNAETEGGEPSLTYNQSTLDVVQHPWFEEVTKQVLRCERALWFQQANSLVHPTASGEEAEVRASAGQLPPSASDEEQWFAGAHCDTQLTTRDWNSTPRRTVLCFWLWLSDVPTPSRAAMRFAPGSHLRTAAHWEELIGMGDQHQQRSELPRIFGTDIRERTDRPDRTTISTDTEPGGWLRMATPQPLLARRGQCTVMTTALLHSAWRNTDSSPRKAMHFAWTADGVAVGLPRNQDELGREIYPRVRQLLRAERRHIVPVRYPHFTSELPIGVVAAGGGAARL